MSFTVPDKMKSPIYIGGGKIKFIEKEVKPPGPGQLLIRLKVMAVCESEKTYYYNGSAAATPGHDLAGVVVASGTMTFIKPGRAGVIYLVDYCGSCRNCLLGYTNQCMNKREDIGLNIHGGHGEYILISENMFYPVESGVPFAETSVLLNVMGIGGHAIRRALQAREDIESVLVTGAGPIGLGILAMTKIMLGRDVPVFLTDSAPYRLNLADRMGGIPVYPGSTNIQKMLCRHGLDKVDVVFDSGDQAKARRKALSCLGKRGVIVYVDRRDQVRMDLSTDRTASDRVVLGSEYFAFDEFPVNAAFLKVYHAYLSQIITHRYSVNQIQEAFDVHFSGQSGKVMVEYEWESLHYKR